MNTPEFRVINKDGLEGVTYVCGCPCEPTARPADSGEPGMEHCCCGKVHFVGANASTALSTYLADRKARRKREPDYDQGSTTIILAGQPAEVAWAFPRE
jgi:hypothetical protein